MKRLFVTVFLFIGTMSYGQGLNMLYNFSNTPNWFNSDITSAVTDTNYFLVTGATSDSFALNYCYVARFNYSGRLEWEDSIKNYQYSNAGGYECMARMGNGGYVMAGEGWDSGINNKIIINEPFLYFFDGQDSNRRFVTYLDSNISRTINALAVDKGDNIIGAGNITSGSVFLSTDSNYYFDSIAVGLFKYDYNGHLLWQKKYFNQQNAGISAYVNVNKIVVSNDGLYYVLAGMKNDLTTNTTQSFYIKTDTAGNVIWSKILPHVTYMGDGSQGYNVDIVPAYSSGYYFVGNNEIFVDSTYQAYIYFGRFDENGVIEWSKNYAYRPPPRAAYEGTNIALDKDGNLLLQGFEGYQIYDPVLLKTDSVGNVIWYREHFYVNQFSPTQQLYTLATTPDGRILTAGIFSNPSPEPYCDTVGALSWIVLSDSLGMRYPGDTLIVPFVSAASVPSPAKHIAIYPNPVTDDVYINTYNNTDISMQLTDISGRALITILLQPGVNAVDMRQYAPGIYIAKLYNNGQLLQTEKIARY
ncbi:MAG: T9SS type A sorting domain-containing protein [Flavipsychrobacter sp.]|nr:T9SS type A sorting domain-containing protein [Flavipsychrobacter sp.]